VRDRRDRAEVAGADVAAVPVGRRGALFLVAASLLGLVAFGWPLVAQPAATGADLAHASDAPWIFVVLLPLLLCVVLAEVADGALDAKAVAVLGVLAACGAVLRLPSGAVGGFEPMFFLLVPAGRVLGRGFGFVLGALTMFVSALLTGGVGPWLPFQMFGAAWMGFGAGCLPPLRGRAEVALLAAYGFVAGLVFGLLLNFWFWPFGISAGTELSFVPGDATVENLRRFWAFHLATSLGWDLPRALTNAVLLAVAGPSVLAALRRAGRRAAFAAPVTFAQPVAPAPGGGSSGNSS
jgi:energy-coupling factor transport system substrate-specific component